MSEAAGPIGARILGGAVWNLMATMARSGTGLVVRLILARLLLPEHFGLIGMAVVFTGFVSTLNELGMAAALIQRKKREIRDIHFDVAFWSTLATGAITLLLMATVVGPLAARFYGEPMLAPVISALSIPLVLHPMVLIPRTQLLRALDYRSVALVEAVAVVVSGIGAVILALAGMGVWSIVGQSILTPLVSVPLFQQRCRWIPRARFSMQALREILGFGLYVTGNSVFGFFARNLDYLLIGKLLGAEALGAYTLAFMLVEALRNKLIGIMDKVLYPAYARLQDDLERLKRYYLLSIRYSSLLVFPAMTTLICYAEPFVHHVVGAKWVAAITPIRILAVSAMIYCVGGTSGSVLRSIGRPDLHFRVFVTKTILITIPALFIGIHFWGVVGAAAAVAFHLAAARLIFQYYLRRFIDVTEGEILRAIAPALVGGVVITTVAAIQYAVFPPKGLASLMASIVIAVGTCAAFLGTFVLDADARAAWGAVRKRLAARAGQRA